MAEDEMVRQQYQLYGYELEQILTGSEGQWNLAHCSPWGHNEWDMTQQLNNTYFCSSIQQKFYSKKSGQKQKFLKMRYREEMTLSLFLSDMIVDR